MPRGAFTERPGDVGYHSGAHTHTRLDMKRLDFEDSIFAVRLRVEPSDESPTS